MKTIIRKSVKISDEIADFINDRWNVQREDMEAQPLVDYLDSLDRIELGMELEKRYGITIMDEEMKDWAWFSDVLRCVCNKVAKLWKQELKQRENCRGLSKLLQCRRVYDTETGTETYDVSELELLGTIIPIATEEIPDYWTRLKHQAAIAAMKELLPQVNDGYEYVHEETAIVAYNYANALIELLKKEERK